MRSAAPYWRQRLVAARFVQASKNQACLGFATSAAKARQRQWEGRTSCIACKAIHEQEEWAKVYANERVETCLHTQRVQLNLDAVNGAPVCRSFSFFFQKRTRLKDYKKNVRKQINGKFYSLKFKIYPHLFSTEPKQPDRRGAPALSIQHYKRDGRAAV